MLDMLKMLCQPRHSAQLHEFAQQFEHFKTFARENTWVVKLKLKLPHKSENVGERGKYVGTVEVFVVFFELAEGPLVADCQN